MVISKLNDNIRYLLFFPLIVYIYIYIYIYIFVKVHRLFTLCIMLWYITEFTWNTHHSKRMTTKLIWQMDNSEKTEDLKIIKTNLSLYLYYIHYLDVKLSPLNWLQLSIHVYVYKELLLYHSKCVSQGCLHIPAGLAWEIATSTHKCVVCTTHLYWYYKKCVS